KGKYTIPDAGTYKITITSDDGTVLKIDNTTYHNQWGRAAFKYSDPLEYYVTRDQGEKLILEILYFEYTVYNRVSFKIERYFGPGVIADDQRISSINPDPVAFTSLAPAEFEDGSEPVYEWFHNTSTDTLTWIPVPNSNNKGYDIPAYNVNADE